VTKPVEININMPAEPVLPMNDPSSSPRTQYSYSNAASIASNMDDDTSLQVTSSMSNVLYIGNRDAFLQFEEKERVDWDFYKRSGDGPNPLKYLAVYLLLQCFVAALFYFGPVEDGTKPSTWFDGWLYVCAIVVIFVWLFILITFLIDTFRYYCVTEEKQRGNYNSILRGHTQKKARKRNVRWITGMIGGFIFLIYCIVMVAASVKVGAKEGTSPTRLRTFVGLCILFEFLICFLFIDYMDAFHVMMRFANSLNTKLPWSKWVIMGLNILGGLALMVIINLDKEEDIYRTVEFIIMFVMFYLTITLLVYFWDIISFTLGNNELSLSVIFFSFFGAIFIFFCRWLHNPDAYIKDGQWAWHRRAKSISKTLNIMIVMSILITVFYPIGGGILSACFASFANWLSGGDDNDISWGAVLLIVVVFMIIAHLMMIAPFAPASLIDVCGGFIFVQIFQKVGASFIVALLATLGLLCASHFTGSCLQWYLGKIPLVQGWLNRTCPVVVLATLDALLKGQGWFRVGLIGSIAPDTINGFAQGRSNLDFCTQFWSEWSAIPNAICTILIGAALSEENLLVLTPILILVALAVNLGMASWALRIVAEEIKNDGYIKSNFKWQVVQNMVRLYGYTPTKEGWKKDVWDLKTLYKKILPMEKAMLEHLAMKNISPLDHKNIHEHYVKIKKEALIDHYQGFTQEDLNAIEEDGLAVYQQRYKVGDHDAFYWDYDLQDPEKRESAKLCCIPDGKYYAQVIILGVLWSTMAYSSMVFSVSTEETVEKGLDVVKENDSLRNGVFALLLHVIVAILYFYQESYRFICRLGQRTKNVCINICGCDEENAKVETNFETPLFTMNEDVMKKHKKKYQSAAVTQNPKIFNKISATSTQIKIVPGMTPALPEHVEQEHLNEVEMRGILPDSAPKGQDSVLGGGTSDYSSGTHESPLACTPSNAPSSLAMESRVDSYENTSKILVENEAADSKPATFDSMENTRKLLVENKRDSVTSVERNVLASNGWETDLSDPGNTPEQVQQLQSNTSDV